MAGNQYGFDFLRQEHTLSDKPPELQNVHIASMEEDDNEPPPAIAAAVAHKPDLEKQFDVIHFLQAHRSSGYLPPSVIYKATGIDLEETDESVAKMLVNNPKIRVEQVPDPENPSIMLQHYAYQAKYNHVRNRDQLLAQINRCKNGVAMRDLIDSYDGVEIDLAALITAGDVMAIHNPEDKDKILFPRGEAFLVELDGIITVPEPPANDAIADNATSSSTPPLTDSHTNEGMNGDKEDNNNNQTLTSDQIIAQSIERAKLEERKKRQLADLYIVDTDVDPRKQIRRGEAVCVGGQWFRVSSAVKEGVPLSEQPVRAQAPLSVTTLSDLAKKNEIDGYIRPFAEKKLPIDAALNATARENLRQAKEAREKLHKLAGGRGASTGPASQLLSSQAHSANPKTLAASFSSSIGGHGMGGARKRPSSHHTKASNIAQARKDAEAAQLVASDPALALYTHARRHGCTKGVRQMFLETRSLVPTADTELRDLMIKHKLLEAGEEWKRKKLPKKANVDNDGKPKKKRYYERKDQRRTNVHLDRTEIGALLAEATERQKQGKSVGDGGM